MKSFRWNLDPVGPLWFLYKGETVWPEFDISKLSSRAELTIPEDRKRIHSEIELREYINTRLVLLKPWQKITWKRSMAKYQKENFGE